jgi:hypothetical protein
MSPEIAGLMRDEMSAVEPTRWGSAVTVYASLISLMFVRRRRVLDAMRRVASPTLLVRGDEDRLTPRPAIDDWTAQRSPTGTWWSSTAWVTRRRSKSPPITLARSSTGVVHGHHAADHHERLPARPSRLGPLVQSTDQPRKGLHPTTDRGADPRQNERPFD